MDKIQLEVKNITVKKYLALEYNFTYIQAFEFIKPKNYINGKSFNLELLTFNEVNTIKILYQDINQDKIIMLFDLCFKEENLLTCSVLEFFQAKKYLDKAIEGLLEREKALLYSPPNPKAIAAGSRNLNRYGSANTTVSIGAQFGFRPRDVGEWLYTEVLIIQGINVTTAEIQRQLSIQKGT
ncbi:MAG: hypothetical protein KUG67_03320 [Proteobacteria bacterium]|nr:hypothetical protein [Pseudomonadota bacterium]